eukprot:29487-Pelagococcus_subviridis.AAC.2
MRREKSLRIGVHHADAVVWEPVRERTLHRAIIASSARSFSAAIAARFAAFSSAARSSSSKNPLTARLPVRMSRAESAAARAERFPELPGVVVVAAASSSDSDSSRERFGAVAGASSVASVVATTVLAPSTAASAFARVSRSIGDASSTTSFTVNGDAMTRESGRLGGREDGRRGRRTASARRARGAENEHPAPARRGRRKLSRRDARASIARAHLEGSSAVLFDRIIRPPPQEADARSSAARGDETTTPRA